MKVRDIVKALTAAGWIEIARKGTSHRQFVHPTRPGKVTVPDHGDGRDLPIGTVRSIKKQAGLQ